MFDISSLYDFLIRIPIVLIALTVHEVAHGYVAYKLGDPTAKALGRLSLNPIRHLDPIGAICMLLFHFGWARPVPVNARHFRNPRRDMALTALAGPTSNFCMAILALIIANYITLIPIQPDTVFGRIIILFYYFFEMFASMNLGLAIFNLIPVPPLDGSRIFLIFLPDRLYFGIMKYERYISFALLALLWFGVLNYPLSYVFNRVYYGIDYLISFLPFL